MLEVKQHLEFGILLLGLHYGPFLKFLCLLCQCIIKAEKRNLVFIHYLFSCIFVHYCSKTHRYTAGLLDVLYFLPVLITYILWNKISAKPVRNLIIFLAVPFSLVAFDKIVTLGFQLSCPFTTLEAEYNPIHCQGVFSMKKMENLSLI